MNLRDCEKRTAYDAVYPACFKKYIYFWKQNWLVSLDYFSEMTSEVVISDVNG